MYGQRTVGVEKHTEAFNRAGVGQSGRPWSTGVQEEAIMELEGQVAIVTGAGRGIGRATALELARMGANIVVAELDKDNAERTAGEVRATGRSALVLPTDVTSRTSLGAMAERTLA